MILINGKKIAAELKRRVKRKKFLELKSKYNKVPGLNCNFDRRRWLQVKFMFRNERESQQMR